MILYMAFDRSCNGTLLAEQCSKDERVSSDVQIGYRVEGQVWGICPCWPFARLPACDLNAQQPSSAKHSLNATSKATEGRSPVVAIHCSCPQNKRDLLMSELCRR